MITCEVWWATPLAVNDDRLSLLSETERQRYAAYRKEADQRRFLTGRVLLRTLAAERLGIEPGAIELDATCPDCDKQHGPPRIPGAMLALSLSHSGDRVGVALTGGAPVGLDVETTTRRAEDALLDYALNETELAAIEGLRGDERADAFFTYWTRKEAVMKATGRGLRIPLRDLTLSAPGLPPRLVAAAGGDPEPEGTRLADLDPGDGYRGAVAVLVPGGEELAVTERQWSPERRVWHG